MFVVTNFSAPTGEIQTRNYRGFKLQLGTFKPLVDRMVVCNLRDD